MAIRFTATPPSAFTRTVVPVSGRPFSVSCLVKPFTVVGGNVPWSLGAGTNDYWALVANQATLFVRMIEKGSSTQVQAETPARLRIGDWNQVGGYVNTNTDRGAVLHGQVTTNSDNEPSPNGTFSEAINFHIVFGGGHADRAIAELGIWNVVLTADEWARLAVPGVTPMDVRRSALVSYTPLLGDTHPAYDRAARTFWTAQSAGERLPHPQARRSVRVFVPAVADDGLEWMPGQDRHIPRIRMVPYALAAPRASSAGAGGGGGGNDFFDNLQSDPNLFASWSMRSQSQLDTFKNGAGASTVITYDPDNDTYSNPQDAAKIFLPGTSSGVGGPNQIWFPLDVSTGVFLFIWDAWTGSEYLSAHSTVWHHKAFMLRDTNEGIFWETRHHFRSVGSNGTHNQEWRGYSGSLSPNTGPGTSSDGHDNLQPMVLPAFRVHADRWVRYWTLINIDQHADAPDFIAAKVWMADEITDPVQMLPDPAQTDDILIELIGNRMSVFGLHYDSSLSARDITVDLTAYARNLIVLQGVTDPSPYFEKPIP